MFELMPLGNRERGLWGYLDNLERNFFQNMTPATGLLRTDITDEGDHFLLSAEMPGFRKEDIKIDLGDGMLTVSARRNEETEETKGSYVRRERRMGSYTRSFDVSGIKTEEITAKYDSGVLSLRLPKEDAQPLPPGRQIEIQ